MLFRSNIASVAGLRVLPQIGVYCMSKAGVVKPGLDLSKGYMLDFVNKGVGLELRPKN